MIRLLFPFPGWPHSTDDQNAPQLTSHVLESTKSLC
jgi:hypothetical protein